jgi:hypothetical protein
MRRDQAPMDGFTASPAIGPPRHPTDSPLLLLLLLLPLAGAGRSPAALPFQNVEGRAVTSTPPFG